MSDFCEPPAPWLVAPDPVVTRPELPAAARRRVRVAAVVASATFALSAFGALTGFVASTFSAAVCSGGMTGSGAFCSLSPFPRCPRR